MMKINENLLSKSDNLGWVNANNIISDNPVYKGSGGKILLEVGKTYTYQNIGGNRHRLLLSENEPQVGTPLAELTEIDAKNPSTDYEKATFTATAPWLFFYAAAYTNRTPNLKLEEGTEATPWIPHRNDLTETQRNLMPEHLFGGVSIGRRFQRYNLESGVVA